MLNVRQVHGNWNETRIQQIINAALEQEIFTFFESSDRKTSWIGIGSTSRITPGKDEDKFAIVNGWFDSIKKELPQKIDPDTIAVLGGFSFEEHNETLPEWGDWSNGMFVLPRIIIKITDENVIVSEIKKHAFSKETIDEVLDKIIELTTAKYQLKKYSITNVEKNWEQQVDALAKQINGSPVLKKVVLGRYKKGLLTGAIDPVDSLKALRSLNKTTYHFMIKVKDRLFISSTPERLFLLKDHQFSTAAVAGTIGRGNSEQSDNQLALSLYKDEKNRAEHEIVVNEIDARIRDFATDIRKDPQPMILKNQTVQHLYTPITAEIKQNINAFDLIKNMHPTPALGGLPYEESMKIIKQNETSSRVLFGAPIGYVTFKGNAEMIVGIRSMLVYRHVFLIFAGAGIMPDSVGKDEFEETELKFQPMIKLLQYLEARHG